MYFIGRAVAGDGTRAAAGRLRLGGVARVPHAARRDAAAVGGAGGRPRAGSGAPRAVLRGSRRESRRLQRLVENLLDFGRLQAGARPYRFEPLEPRALVERVVTEFPARCRTRLPCRHLGDDRAGRVLADPDAVGLALYNLLDNAVKYAGADATSR